MKQFSTLILIILAVFACTRKSSTLNAGEVALGQSYATPFGGEEGDGAALGGDTKKGDLNAIDTSLQISNYVRFIFQENSKINPTGVLWFATYGQGVGRYNPAEVIPESESKFAYYSRTFGLSGNEVRDIQEDRKGNIWFATNGGVSSYAAYDEHAKNFTNITMKQGLISNNVWTIMEDRDGYIWFGTDSGVCRYNPSLPVGSYEKAFITFPLPEADLRNFSSAYPAPKLVNKIFQDKMGIIWFGTNGNGVFCFDPSTFSAKNEQPQLTHFSEKNGLCSNFIHGIYQDRKGDIWFSSRFGGVSRYSPEVAVNSGGKSSITSKSKFLNLTKKDGLSSNFVWSVIEDKEGNFWFATAGGGVDFLEQASSLKLDNNSQASVKELFINYDTTNGLASDYVQSIMEDNLGNLWFSTGDGVSRYVPFSGPKASWILFTSYPSKGNGC